MKTKSLVWLLLILAGRTFAQDSIFNRIWNDPVVTGRIEQNIEKYRKGDAMIEVVGKNGKQVKR